MEEPPPITETMPSEPPPVPTMSLAARLLNVFAIPGDVFDEVKKTASSVGNWLVPTLLLMAVGLVGVRLVYSQPAVQQQMREMNDRIFQKLVDKGRLTQEQADRQRDASEAGSKVSPYVGFVFSAIISPFWWGLIIWLVGKKAFKGGFTFMKAVEVAGLSSAISVLESIVTTLLSVSLGSLNGSPSAALLVKNYDPQNTSHALLSLANVMTVWVLAVRAIGLARLSGTRFAPAAAWVFGIWAGYMGFFIALGLAIRAALGF
jgi:hypothetical protein